MVTTLAPDRVSADTAARRGRRAVRASRLGAILLGLALLAIMLFPVYWLFASSMETSQQIFTTPPFLVPPTPTLASYGTALGVLGRSLVNSVAIAVGTMLLSLVLGAPAAYAMAHLRLRLTLALLLVMLITQMFPSVMMATPLFIIYNHIHLVNTYPGLILADSITAVPFVVLVLRAYMLTIPFELTEAAMVDGTGYWGAFLRVILPVATPGLATAALFTFLNAWRDFTYGLTLTTPGSDIQPVTLGLYNFVQQHNTEWNNLMAGGVLTSLPAIVLLLGAQRYISAGLTAGAVKG